MNVIFPKNESYQSDLTWSLILEKSMILCTRKHVKKFHLHLFQKLNLHLSQKFHLYLFQKFNLYLFQKFNLDLFQKFQRHTDDWGLLWQQGLVRFL